MFKYYKKQMPSGAIIYRGLETVMELGKKERELVEYAFETVRTLGITDGPVHGEYMIDEKGPVLIEVNCRVMGGSAPVDFLDKVFGYHETDVILECMLDSDYHSEFLKRPYRPLRKGYAKDFYSDRDKPISSSGIIPIVLNMRSYNSGWIENAGKTRILHEIIDLETEIGCIYLVHDDPEVTKKDFELLMLIEEKYPNLFHSDSPLFIPPEKNEDFTPKIREIFNKDTETLITDIIAYYRNGAKGEPIVPEALLESNPYNREIMELFREIAGGENHYSP